MKKIIFLFILIISYALLFNGDNMNFENINNYKRDNLDRYIKYKNNNKNLTNNEIVKRVNLDLDYDFYTNIKNSINIDTNLVLVNKYYKLSKDYIPKNLKKIDYKYTSGLDIYADKDAIKKFIEMCIDAYTLGLNIKTISAYRTYKYQENLYNKYLEEDDVSIVDTYSARAGHSEHQTGLAFDLYNVKSDYTKFGNTDEFKWLKDNAHRYGFILRYQKNKEYITGYKYEPWHIRYVGIDNASYIYYNNLTLEEYLLNK